MREILTDIQTDSGGGKVSVMYFEDTPDVASQRALLNTFWQAVVSNCNQNATFTVRTEGRELDEATGTLTGAWNDSTPYVALGEVTGDPVPDASQALVRWSTGAVVGGRFLRGRTFIPMIASQAVVNGNLGSGAQDSIAGAAGNFASSAAGLQIWSRPKGGGIGTAFVVTGASCWQEFAVLRRRRS
uniref:Uncharacterized protein n=1 Tax=uncultured prokaryote TaxID=198431 RepID=A0A0H5QLW5_9ZZZZ|nr:hypothetical protein [uncultured prokaryote]